MMNLFYAHSDDIYPSELSIRGQEAIHITRVLRFGEGDEIFVTDGKGSRFICVINRIGKQELTAEIREKVIEERPSPFLTLCLGIIKKRDRLELAAEKAVELGADELILFRGEYSQKENSRLDRLEATVLSAMKQSLRTWLPSVYHENSLERALMYRKERSLLIVADETTNPDVSQIKEAANYFLVVGPEGGFSDNERKVLNDREAIPFSLGSKRLRTETAAIVMTYHFKSNF